jgi:hypothetical protein
MASHKTQIVMTTPKTKTTKKATSKKSNLPTITHDEYIMLRLDSQTKAIAELYDSVEFLDTKLDMTVKIIGGIACASLLLGIGLAATAIIRLF